MEMLDAESKGLFATRSIFRAYHRGMYDRFPNLFRCFARREKKSIERSSGGLTRLSSTSRWVRDYIFYFYLSPSPLSPDSSQFDCFSLNEIAQNRIISSEDDAAIRAFQHETISIGGESKNFLFELNFHKEKNCQSFDSMESLFGIRMSDDRC